MRVPEVLGVGDVADFIHLGRDDTEVHRPPSLPHEAIDSLRTHQDNDGVLRAHSPVVLLPIWMLLVAAGAKDLTQHAPELLGFGVPRLEQLRLALDTHPTTPIFGDSQHRTAGVATQV